MTRVADLSRDTLTSSNFSNIDSAVLEICYALQIPVTAAEFEL